MQQKKQQQQKQHVDSSVAASFANVAAVRAIRVVVVAVAAAVAAVVVVKFYLQKYDLSCLWSFDSLEAFLRCFHLVYQLVLFETLIVANFGH